MAQDAWDSRPNDSNWYMVASLAWKIVTYTGAGGMNPYDDAMRLTAARGNNKDEEIWLDMTRGNAVTEQWYHRSQRAVVRSARIPYVITLRKTGGSGRRYLDHLLVGYTDYIDMPTGATTGDWDTTGGGGNVHNLRVLGNFLTGDLWPEGIGLIKRVQGWQDPVSMGNPFGYDPVPQYGGGPPWTFRGLSIKPEASVAISMFNDSGQRRYLLIGYEGGGGW
jgi:hypothetical protein